MHAAERERNDCAPEAVMSGQMEMVHFNKDVALAGAALAFFWVFAQEPGLILTGPLF
jgi:hypothetical protein